MRYDPRKITDSWLTLRLVHLLGRLIPPRIGYPLAYRLANIIASKKDWDMVRAVRCNQWVVGGRALTSEELDQAVHETFRNTAHSVYDLQHYTNNPKAIHRLIEMNPDIQNIIDQSRSNEAGQILASLHFGNFDLALQTLSLRGLQGTLFSLPPTQGGYQVQYEIRKNTGLDVQPIDMNVLRRAVKQLKEGGTVITMIDWPLPESKYSPFFFGHPSPLPVHYILLALKANVPIVVAVMIRQKDGRYNFLVSDPIQMQQFEDRHSKIIRNAEAVLKIAEGFIQQAPQQWMMSRPYWSALMDKVPE